MYPTEFHEKFYIARGNVFDVESFWADGVAAFVKGGFNNISASYDEFKSHPHITDFVKFGVKISIIIDYLRKFYYICILKLDKSAHHKTKHQENDSRKHHNQSMARLLRR